MMTNIKNTFSKIAKAPYIAIHKSKEIFHKNKQEKKQDKNQNNKPEYLILPEELCRIINSAVPHGEWIKMDTLGVILSYNEKLKFNEQNLSVFNYLHLYDDYLEFRIQKASDYKIDTYIRIKENAPLKQTYHNPWAKMKTPLTSMNIGGRYGWAIVKHEKYEELADLAMPESWDFGNTETRKLIILKNYINITFKRLVHEKKILFGIDYISEDESIEKAAFNTGLFDKRYSPIYAIFLKNNYENQDKYWYLKDFVVSDVGEGKRILNVFGKFPERANYFQDLNNIVYVENNKPINIEWAHIIIERLHRLPLKLLKKLPEEILSINGKSIDDIYSLSPNSEEKESYFRILRRKLQDQPELYRELQTAIQSAFDLALKKATWNYKTVVPIYYPRTAQVSLLFPLYITDLNKPDITIVVQRNQNGTAQAKTILPLDWAYIDSRVIVKPEVNWLEPKNIISSTDNDN